MTFSILAGGLALALPLVLGNAAPARAQDAAAAAPAQAPGSQATTSAMPMPVGTFRSWAAYTFEDKGRLMCYAQSAPSGSIGEPSGRGQAAVMVIQAPDAAAKDQVSIVLGFTPQDGKTVTAIIGNRAGKGKKYSLKKFGIGRAWAETDALDQQIVAALKKSNWLVVQSVSSKGAKVQDTYNLSGFGKAYDAAVKACR